MCLKSGHDEDLILIRGSVMTSLSFLTYFGTLNTDNV